MGINKFKVENVKCEEGIEKLSEPLFNKMPIYC